MKGKLAPFLCSAAGTAILLAVVVSCLPLAVPKLMGYQVYGVVSGSMEPAISVGSVVYVGEAAPEEIGDGDIIAFHKNGSVVTHRVVRNRIVEGEYVTKGDANEEADPVTARYEDLIGRVEYHIPLIGKLLVLYGSGLGKFYVVCFAACGAMLNMLAGRLRARKKEEEAAQRG